VHPLKAYLKQTETTEAAFAAKAGTTSSYLSQIICGQRWPSRALADAIEAAAGGAVKAAELLTWKPQRAA